MRLIERAESGFQVAKLLDTFVKMGKLEELYYNDLTMSEGSHWGTTVQILKCEHFTFFVKQKGDSKDDSQWIIGPVPTESVEAALEEIKRIKLAMSIAGVSYNPEVFQSVTETEEQIVEIDIVSARNYIADLDLPKYVYTFSWVEKTDTGRSAIGINLKDKEQEGAESV